MMTEPPQKKRNMLTPEGRKYLEGIWNSGLRLPSSLKKTSMLQEIRTFEGCEQYSESSLSNWFSHRRERDKKKQIEQQIALGPAHAYLYPSITYDELLKLGALYEQHIRDTGSPPTDDLVLVWSRALTAKPDHVRNWVDEKNAKTSFPSRPKASSSSHRETQSSLDRTNETRSLPTPSHSTSPEPIAGSSFVKKEPPRSPIIGHSHLSNPPQQENTGENKDRIRRLSIVSTHLPSPVSPGFPEDKLPAYVRQSVKAHAQVQPARSDVPSTTNRKELPLIQNQAPSPYSIAKKQVASLLSRLPNQAVQDPAAPSSKPPTNASNFSQSFLPHETKMREMLNQISSGKLRSVGLDPSLVSDINESDFPLPLPDQSDSSSRLL